ncbi:MAG: histidinol-phosphate transaminase [Sandaracinaceae bacterium]
MSIVPSYIDRLVPYRPGKPIEELERELGIQDAVKLASNESPLGPSPLAIEAMRAHASQVHRYPDAAGWALRTDLAAQHGTTLDELVLGNGSNELINLICMTYASPADHAVIGMPSFVCYPLGLTMANVPFTAVPLVDHLAWDVDAMLEAVRPETRLLFLANPNNPTGAHVGRADLERLLTSLPPRVVAVVDEAYVHFADAPDYVTALELRHLRERLIVLRTFSKAHGLAALRVGYGIGPAPLIEYLHRTRAPFNVGTLGQVAARAAIQDQAHVERYVELNRRERARVGAALTDLGLEVAPSQANFVFARVEEPGAAVYERLLRRGVIVRPMPAPVENWLRITIGLEAENDRLLAELPTVLSGDG